MRSSFRGWLGIVVGIAFCIMQATGKMGSGANGFLLGGILIVLGVVKILMVRNRA